MRAILRIAGGIFLVLIGIIGLIVPIMPGWVFLIPGLIILGDYFPPIKRLLKWATDKAKKHDPGLLRRWQKDKMAEEPVDPAGS